MKLTARLSSWLKPGQRFWPCLWVSRHALLLTRLRGPSALSEKAPEKAKDSSQAHCFDSLRASPRLRLRLRLGLVFARVEFQARGCALVLGFSYRPEGCKARVLYFSYSLLTQGSLSKDLCWGSCAGAAAQGRDYSWVAGRIRIHLQHRRRPNPHPPACRRRRPVR